MGLFFIIICSQLTFAFLWNSKEKKLFMADSTDRIKKEFLINFGRRLKVVWVLFFIVAAGFMSGFFGLTVMFMIVSFLALREFVSIMHLRSSDYWPPFLLFLYFFTVTIFLCHHRCTIFVPYFYTRICILNVTFAVHGRSR